MTTQSNSDAVATSTLDDSIFDVDLIAVDDLINNATRLLNEVLNNRPIPPPVPAQLSPREDAIQQVQLFLNSIRDEANQDDDVVFVEERPGNAPPSTARTIPTVVDLCSPSVEETTQRTPPRRRGRRSASSRSQPNVTPPKTRRRQPKNEPGTEAVAVDDSTSSIDDQATAAEGQGTLQCPICMMSVLNRRPSSTICGHIFCQQCIFQAIRLNSKCPMCKTKLKKNQVHRVYF